MTDTHVAAYFDGRGGKKHHTGTVWDCPKGRCMEWTALWRHDLHAAIERSGPPTHRRLSWQLGATRRMIQPSRPMPKGAD